MRRKQKETKLTEQLHPRHGDTALHTTFIIKVDSREAQPVAPPRQSSEAAGTNREPSCIGEATEWSDPTSRVVATVWSRTTPPKIHRGIQVTAGRPVEVEDRLAGHFSRISLDRSGRGVIQTDPYGLHPLYIGRTHGLTLIANRPDLIAHELERHTGETAERDMRFAAWIAFSGYPIGNRTGYKDVRCVPFGATIYIHPRRGVRFSVARPPWLAEELPDIDRCIDRIESELVANLRAAVASMDHVPRLQLTGGRDSRLVLALAIRGGLLKDVEVVTLGAPDSPDATVAKELATRLGISHTARRWRDGVVARHELCSHVRLVAGAVGCFDSNISLAQDKRMSLSGFVGETLRTNWPRRIGYRDLQSVADGFLSQPHGKTGVLQRDAHVTAFTDGLRSMLGPAERDARTEDLFDAYYIQHRVRRWLACRPERLADEFLPLYHPPATELAFQMGWRERSSGRIHDIIIGRAGRVISEPAYYKPGGYYKTSTTFLDSRNEAVSRALVWRTRIARGVRDGILAKFTRLENASEASIYSETDSQFKDLIASSVEHSLRKSRLDLSCTMNAADLQFNRRQRNYRDLLFARDDNPAFSIFDRERLVEAVGALRHLDASAANEVHGAMTGVIWLGRLENELCPQ